MTEPLEEKYPEAASYIQHAVDEHGDDWAVEHYSEQLHPLGRLMVMPEKDELPFYDPDEDETMRVEYRGEMYEAWAQNREPLRTGTRPEEGLPSPHFREGNRWETHGSRFEGLSRRTPLERTTDYSRCVMWSQRSVR